MFLHVSVLHQIHSWLPCQEFNKLARDMTMCACHSGAGNRKKRKRWSASPLSWGASRVFWVEPQSCFDRHSQQNRRFKDGESTSVFTLELRTDGRPSQRFSQFRSVWPPSRTAHGSRKFEVVTTLLRRLPQVCPPNLYPVTDLVFSLFLPPYWAGISLEWTRSGSFE